jgi:hypothetical protein
MKIECVFSAAIPDAVARERVTTFLVQAGCKQLPNSADGSLLFQRGSLWGMLTSFDPGRWSCAFSVKIKSEGPSSILNIEAEIATDPTEKHFAAELLTAEFNLLETAVTANEIKSFDTGSLKKRIAAHVARIVMISAAMMTSAVIGVIAGAFSSFSLKFTLLASTTIGIGFLVITAALFALILRRQKKI